MVNVTTTDMRHHGDQHPVIFHLGRDPGEKFPLNQNTREYKMALGTITAIVDGRNICILNNVWYIGAQPSHLVVNDHPPDNIEEVPATVPIVQAPVVNDNQPDNIEEVPATVPVVEPPVNPEKTKSDSDKEALSERIKILESDSDNDALSKSIKILRNLLKAETGKKEYWERKYRELA